ncbi:MAG: bifunctional methylenetetrahydrofolate dehydrogenase/methenyltetrahydrofolate cyclohydrolase FolD [Legionellales bacterium]|nr:bifunctional methylenetetrahydrofolate dehydrogenase/methenyltetrahydrofolate cyclohydrolase FolD [Legionellales bacterium]
MTAQRLDGKLVAQTLRAQLHQQVDHWLAQGHRQPGLAVIMVGDDPASEIYITNKRKACVEAGFYNQFHHLTADISQAQLLQLIDQLNHDTTVDGILIQLPLPASIDADMILERIHPDKDVDGFHPYNLGRLAQRRPLLRPCTPYGIIQLLQYYQVDVRGLNATVVGASNIVGRPMSLELLLAGATPTVCHRFTRELASHVQRADLLIVATGHQDVVKPDWVKPGSIVIDVGIHRLADGRLRGDLEFASVQSIAKMITPVPGGVGPMTIHSLLANTFFAATQLHQPQ